MSHYIDQGDQDASDGITPDELAGAVHGSIEVRLERQTSSLTSGLVLGDEPSGQVAVDAHLLAGQGVQGEPGSDFRHASRALGDHHELDNHDDQEDHHTQYVIPFHHKLSEGVYHIPCVCFAKDQTRGRHV